MKVHRVLTLAASWVIALTPGFAQTVTRVIGTSTPGFLDNVAASQAEVNQPTGIAFDSVGDLIFADNANYRIRMIAAVSGAPTGTVSTIAGSGTELNSQQPTPPVGPALQYPLYDPLSVVVATGGTVYFADYTTDALANGQLTPDLGPEGTYGIEYLAADGQGNVYAAGLDGSTPNSGCAVFRYVPGGTPVAVFGDPNNAEDDNLGGPGTYPLGDNGPALLAHCFQIGGIAADSNGDVYVTDPGNCRVRTFKPGGLIKTIAGTGTCNPNTDPTAGDNGLATSAELNFEGGGGIGGGAGSLAVDPSGNVFFADTNDHIRKIATNGTISAYAGEIGASGGNDYPGAGGTALDTSMDINFLATDSQGNLYVSTGNQNSIFAIAPSTVAIGSVPVVAAVVSATGNLPGLTPQSWVAIYGTKMANTSGPWDFTGTTLPTSIDGVSVTIDGIPAPVSYVSPGQINALVPDDSNTGEVPVVVTNNGLSSAPYMVQMLTVAPAFFQSGTVSSMGIVSAQDYTTGYSLVTPSSPASPGDTVILYGTGFGPTTPDEPTAVQVSSFNNLTDPISLTIGGQPATVEYAGLIAAGLYQINLVVPSTVASGNQPIVATLTTSAGNVTTQTNVILPVQ